MFDHCQRFMVQATSLNQALRESVAASLLSDLQQERRELASQALLSKYQSFFYKLQAAKDLGTWSHGVEGEVVKFSVKDSSSLAANLDIAQWFKPWKKGPFQLDVQYIDSEWRSDLKWQRIVACLSELSGKRVLDIGANNGYYMYRLEQLQPAWVMGLEPMFRHALQFYWFNCLSPSQRLFFELLGIEHLKYFQPCFDVVLCLGVAYHSTDPIALFAGIRRIMARGGLAIIDCQGIAGCDEVALLPRARYMGNKGFWWLPTESCLKNMIHRAGFKNVDLIFSGPLTSDEQRATEWASISSLADRLDEFSDNPVTEEGYPRPWRFYFVAQG